VQCAQDSPDGVVLQFLQSCSFGAVDDDELDMNLETVNPIGRFTRAGIALFRRSF
jgi:hypothetical protein